MNFNQHTLEEFEAEITSDEPVLANLMKDHDWHWFRYQFLAEGGTQEKRAAIRAFLVQRGYKMTGVTMSFGDYMWNEPYARCRTKKDQEAIELLETSYLAGADQSISYYRSMAKRLFSHIPYVLLMHVGAFDAELLPRLLDLYKSKDFEFVRLEDAESDPFYREDTGLDLPAAPDSMEEAMSTPHLGLPSQPQPEVQLDNICRCSSTCLFAHWSEYMVDPIDVSILRLQTRQPHGRTRQV